MDRKIFFILMILSTFILGCSSKTYDETPIKTAELNEYNGISDLILRLTNNNYTIRQESSNKLADTGKDAVPEIISFLEKQPYYNTTTESFRARWESVNVLGKIKDETAVGTLVDRVLKDKESHVRWRSLWALSSINSNKTVNLFLENIDNDDEFIRWNSAVGLGYFKDKTSVPVLLEGLTSDDDWTKWEAIYVLGIVKDKSSASYLIKMLNDPSIKIRQETALALGKIGDKAAADSLIKALDDESPEVRWRVASSLADLEIKDSIENIQEALEKETNEIAKENMNKSLQKLKQ